jgi:tRNA G10  N-methylase Trm11
MLGMRCIGMDIDGNAVEGAKSNLKWMGKDFGEILDFTVIRGDARNIGNVVTETIDAVAFEPELGPVHIQKPDKLTAEKILKTLAELYRDFLISVDSCLRSGGRVAMTVPAINTTEGRVSLDLEGLVKQTPFRIRKLLPKSGFLTEGPTNKRLRIITDRVVLPERKRGQTVERELLVLER